VIFWNATHGWASFAYQGNRAGGFQGLRPEMVLEALVGQVLYLTPWVFVALIVVVARLARRGPRDWSAPEAFLLCQSVPALGLFLGVSTFHRIMAHWPMIGFVGLLPILGRTCAEYLEVRPVATRRALVLSVLMPVILGTLFVVQARTGLFQDSRGRLLGLIPARVDPTVDTIRWGQIAGELERRGLLDAPGTFLFTDCWRFSAELEMATHRQASVACFHRDSRSFTFWSRPEDWVGKDGIFISVPDGMAGAKNYLPWFRKVEPIATFPIVRAGVPLQYVSLYRCVTMTDPFPFGFTGPGPVPLPKPRLEPTRSDPRLTLEGVAPEAVKR
jgi:hypothetical protein